MAAGRHQVAYEGIDYEAMTLKIDQSTILADQTKAGGSSQVGLAVTLSADDTVALAADGDFVLGKLISVAADGFCTVQFEGLCLLPAGTGAALTRGKAIVGALLGGLSGYIREVASGTAAELARQNGHIINSAVTTAVVVDL